MKKRELADRILAMLSDEEWDGLESGCVRVPVNPYNREVLLRLRETADELTGETDAERADEIEEKVQSLLDGMWPEEPDAHKYVVAACLVLTLLEEKPMHPPASVKYHTEVREGKAYYYCPARVSDGPVCALCLARPWDELETRRRDMLRKTEETCGSLSAAVQKEILEAGFGESGVIPVRELRFHVEVRKCCEDNRCGAYGTSWACPPAVGTLAECRERTVRCAYLQLFSRAYLLEDSMDFDGMKRAMADFKRTVSDLGKRMREILPDTRILSNESCGRCASCTYPDAPCRFPEEMYHSLEGYGFNVSELAGQAGIRYMNGPSTVTFLGAVLYGKPGNTGEDSEGQT